MAQHFRWLTRRILPLPLRTSGTARACGRSIRERHSLITARPRRISATDPVASRWSTVTFRERNRTLCAHLGNQSESVTRSEERRVGKEWRYEGSLAEVIT